jgi:hypothetical protein
MKDSFMPFGGGSRSMSRSLSVCENTTDSASLYWHAPGSDGAEARNCTLLPSIYTLKSVFEGRVR